tara:strand:+ start:73516 stop:73845 length:330 start_codon:yes stop_codon:yes gene_type:complete
MNSPDEEPFYSWFVKIQADLAETLRHMKESRGHKPHESIRLLIDFDIKEYTLYSLNDEDFAYHSTEYGVLITKDNCTHLSYIDDFDAIDFSPGWELLAAKRFEDWMQTN